MSEAEQNVRAGMKATDNRKELAGAGQSGDDTGDSIKATLLIRLLCRSGARVT